MKKIKLVLIIMMVFVGTVVSAEETKLKFAIGEWEPYTGAEMNKYGFAAEIVTAACKASGIKAEYEFFPWLRAEKNVAEKSHFGTFPYTITKEREEIYYISDALFKSSDAILMHKTNPKTKNFAFSKREDLKGFIVGTLLGSDGLTNPLKQAGVSVEVVSKVEQNLNKLDQDKIDFYIDDRAVIYQKLHKFFDKEKVKNFKFLEKDYSPPKPFYILVSKEYPNAKVLISKFNQGMVKIKESGEYKAILIKYGMYRKGQD
jgi:polar amino acid transport system substrate-binding protein